jgi:hypothetical protein
MRPRSGSLEGASAASAALAGGRAPARWQRHLAQAVARGDGLRRACEWVEPATRLRPSLLEEPLLGSCLAELASQAARPAEGEREPAPAQPVRRSWADRAVAHHTDERRRPAERTSRPVQRRLGAEKGPPGRTEKDSQASAERARRQRARRQQPPPELEAKASRRLLRRLAGEGSRAETAERERGGRPGGLPEAKRRAGPAAPPGGDGGQGWLRGVAERAERVLHEGGPARQIVPRAAQAERTGRDEAPRLAAQWAIPLEGEAAPADLLARLIDGPGSPPQGHGQVGSDSDGRGRDGARRAGAKAAPSERASRELPGGRRAQGRSTRAASEVAQWAMAALTPAQQAAGGARAADVGEEAEGGDGGAAKGWVAPPRVARSLPPLLPAQEVGEPTPTVARAAVDKAAAEEAGAGGEDLNELAARIKRILDEEARRYGIDV